MVQLHLFFNRVALICNLLFLYCFVVRHTRDYIQNVELNSIIITLGWGVAFFWNLILHICLAYLKIKHLPIVTPKWLLILNSTFLLLQIVFLLFG